MHVSIIFLVTILFFSFSIAGLAQSPQSDNEDIQSWNEIELSIPLSEKVELSLNTTYRFGDNISRFNEGRVGAGLEVELHKSFSVAGGYNYIEARDSSERFRTEHRYRVNGVYRFPIKAFNLSHRSQYEYRVRSSGNSWRYRPSITIEKKLPDSFLANTKVFLTEEPFYVSTQDRFSRNRISAGIKKKVSDHFSLDIYYLRQNDGTSRPGDLHVIGTNWKFNL